MDPPPLATANVTLTPETGLLLTSATLTEGGFATVAPTTADCPFDEAFATVIEAAGPATKFTVAVLVRDPPAIEALTTAGPALVEDVSVAVYVPLFWSETALSVPRVADIVSVPALFPTEAPCASFNATVICDDAVPFATIDD